MAFLSSPQHGGGYRIGTAHEKDSTANIVRSLIKDTPVTKILSVDYRLMDDAPFPAARKPSKVGKAVPSGWFCSVLSGPTPAPPTSPVIDALTGYAYLVETCRIPPSRIVVAGDSAGGNLTLALTRYLRDENIFALPAALLLLSPWTDMSHSHRGPKSSWETNEQSDYVSRGAFGLLH